MKKWRMMIMAVLVSLITVGVVWAAGQAEAVSDEPSGEITWMVLSDWPTDEFIAAFNSEYPDITVKVEKVGFNEMMQQIQIRMSAQSNTPDVLSVDGPLVASYGFRGWLEPLDDLFTTEEKEDWLPSSLDAGRYDGKLLAAPQSTSTQLLYFNRDLFRAAGITPPGPNERWTWEQVIDAAKKLTMDTNGDGTNDIWGFVPEQIARIYQLQPLPLSLGGEAIGADGLTVSGVINSQPWIDAFTFYWKIFNEWNVGPQGDIFWPPDIFETGNLAMFVGGPWDISRFSDAELDFEWGVSRHPYFEGGDVVTVTGGWHRGVNVFSDNKEAAKTFVRWSTTDKGAEAWWRIGNGDMPAQQSVLDLFATNPEFNSAPMSYMRIAAEEATVNPVPRPVTVGFLEYEQILFDAFQDIRNGTRPNRSLNTAVERIEREMEKYRN